eukprot:m.97807 g.97807  ORF g.97807 m.97807 type:complete len:1254 (+) comp13990_c1_seq1:106-3867(+)
MVRSFFPTSNDVFSPWLFGFQNRLEKMALLRALVLLCACLAGSRAFISDISDTFDLPVTDTCVSFCALLQPCLNGGTCFDGTDASDSSLTSCVCPQGYTGTFCETLVNTCFPNPCANGGRCTPLVNDFSCTCAPGFTGPLCQNDINECLTLPNACRDGCCRNLPGNYTCDCFPGAVGPRCTPDFCASRPCQNGGVCTNLDDTFSCDCPPKFDGEGCTSLRADYNGDCVFDESGKVTCFCEAGYSGTFCNQGNPEWSLHDGCSYLFVSQPQSWATARAACNLAGAELVSIHNEDDNTFVLRGGSSAEGTWIGLQRDESRWSDGSAIDYLAWDNDQPGWDDVCVRQYRINGTLPWTGGGSIAWGTSSCSLSLPSTCKRCRSRRRRTVCPVVTCRCKSDAIVVWSTDSNGCSTCSCQTADVTSTVATTRAATTIATTTTRATTAAATTIAATTVRATTAAPTTTTTTAAASTTRTVVFATRAASTVAASTVAATTTIAATTIARTTTAVPTTEARTTQAATTARQTTPIATTRARTETPRPTTRPACPAIVPQVTIQGTLPNLRDNEQVTVDVRIFTLDDPNGTALPPAVPEPSTDCEAYDVCLGCTAAGPNCHWLRVFEGDYRCRSNLTLDRWPVECYSLDADEQSPCVDSWTRRCRCEFSIPLGSDCSRSPTCCEDGTVCDTNSVTRLDTRQTTVGKCIIVPSKSFARNGCITSTYKAEDFPSLFGWTMTQLDGGAIAFDMTTVAEKRRNNVTIPAARALRMNSQRGSGFAFGKPFVLNATCGPRQGDLFTFSVDSELVQTFTSDTGCCGTSCCSNTGNSSNIDCPFFNAQYYVVSDGEYVARVETGIVNNPTAFALGTNLRVKRGDAYVALVRRLNTTCTRSARDRYLALKMINVFERGILNITLRRGVNVNITRGNESFVVPYSRLPAESPGRRPQFSWGVEGALSLTYNVTATTCLTGCCPAITCPCSAAFSRIVVGPSGCPTCVCLRSTLLQTITSTNGEFAVQVPTASQIYYLVTDFSSAYVILSGQAVDYTVNVVLPVFTPIMTSLFYRAITYEVQIVMTWVTQGQTSTRDFDTHLRTSFPTSTTNPTLCEVNYLRTSCRSAQGVASMTTGNSRVGGAPPFNGPGPEIIRFLGTGGKFRHFVYGYASGSLFLGSGVNVQVTIQQNSVMVLSNTLNVDLNGASSTALCSLHRFWHTFAIDLTTPTPTVSTINSITCVPDVAPEPFPEFNGAFISPNAENPDGQRFCACV